VLGQLTGCSGGGVHPDSEKWSVLAVLSSVFGTNGGILYAEVLAGTSDWVMMLKGDPFLNGVRLMHGSILCLLDGDYLLSKS